MRSLWVAVCVTACWVLTAHAVVVEGRAGLSSGAPPEGIEVIFTQAYPPAQTDTAYTNRYGTFEINLVSGWYNVTYGYPGYALYEMGTVELRGSASLPMIVLMPPLRGTLDGTIGPGDFQVTDSLYVRDGRTATLEPGTRLFFERTVPFRVAGRLIAVGTPEDSIVFSRRYAGGYEATWRGFTFLNADAGSQLGYVVVEHATKVDYHHGGGMYYLGAPVTITHSTFRYNHADVGGGLYVEQSTALVVSCAFIENITNSGAGMAMSRSVVTVSGCLFQGNAAYYTGGGIYAENLDSSTVVGCDFVANSAFDGAGIAILSVPTRIRECLFARNYSSRASGILCNGANGALISRCTVTASDGPLTSAFSSLSIYGGAPTISSIIISEAGVRYGVMLSQAQGLHLQHSDIYVPGGVPFGFTGNDSSQGPNDIGVADTFNVRGDSCDGYQNIFLDPEFVSQDSGDYHLNYWSPCIDAGDPNLTPDPDGTVADMGAFYHSQMKADDPSILRPSSFILSNYPNPFNAVTQIRFELPRDGEAELVVFDVTGRETATLLSGPVSGGAHVVNFDAGSLPSGIYFCQLRSNGLSLTRKLVLLK